MIAVLALLWLCSLAGAGLALYAIRELTTVDPVVAAYNRRTAALTALERINARHTFVAAPAARSSIAPDVLRAAAAGEHVERGHVPTGHTGRFHPGLAAGGSAASASGREVGAVDQLTPARHI